MAPAELIARFSVLKERQKIRLGQVLDRPVPPREATNRMVSTSRRHRQMVSIYDTHSNAQRRGTWSSGPSPLNRITSAISLSSMCHVLTAGSHSSPAKTCCLRALGECFVGVPSPCLSVSCRTLRNERRSARDALCVMSLGTAGCDCAGTRPERGPTR